MIKDLVNGNRVDEVFYCKQKTSALAKNGSTYYSIILQDMTGTIDAKIWEMTDLIEAFDAGDFIHITGTVGSFRDMPQINITGVEVVDSAYVDMEDFCPQTPKNTEDLKKKLITYVDSISNEYLKKLLECFFKNEKFMAGFTKSSAAKTVHHAYMGGLLEHSVTVADICESLAPIYPKVNRDLLITVALCHDIGKVKELSAFPENDYTDIGQLLGHIYMGAEMIDVQARKIEGFPRTLLNELKHCILAHHGKLEYGSPQTPKLIEAQLLSIADDADAKMRRFSDALDDVTDYEWSERQDYFLGSKYRATRG